MLKYSLYFVLFIAIFSTDSLSQLIIQPRLVFDNYTIDDSNFPKLTAEIRVLDQGNPIVVDTQHIVIMEGAFITKPIEVTPLANTWFRVTWIPEKQDFTGQTYRAAMVVTVDKKVGANSNFLKPLKIMPYFNIVASVNQKEFAIREYNFGACSPGDSIPVLFKFKGLLQNEEGTESKMFLDSITVKNKNNFILRWDGANSGSDDEPPPRELFTYGTYRLFVYFKPETKNAYHDELIFHYQSGLKIIIPLYGNLQTVPNNTVLKLIQPIGGELLTPCEKYVIKWRGNTTNLPTKVEVTFNGGADWSQLALVKDSQFVWTVPDLVSDKVRVRVSQAFQEPSAYNVNDGASLPQAVAFNSTDSRLINVAQDGYIYEWDLVPEKPVQIARYELNTAGNDKIFQVSGAEYIKNDSVFWVSYYDTEGYRDSIAYFSYSNGTLPYKTEMIDAQFSIKQAIMDSKKKYLALSPQFGNQLSIYDIENSQITKTEKFETIINDAAFNPEKDTLSVILLNGDLFHFSVPNLSLIQKNSFPKLTNISKVATSPNGDYLALSQVKYSTFDGSDYQGLNTKHFVADMKSGNIIRVYEPAGGDAVTLTFNSASSSIFIGSESQNQLGFYDMATSVNGFTMAGNQGRMYYAKMAHNGKAIASAGDNMRDLVYRAFNYPERVTGNSFSILYPDINTNEIVLGSQHIATSKTYRINSICNSGPVNAIFSDAKLRFGKHFSFEKPWLFTEVNPNKCLDFNFEFSPKDTGWIRDTIQFVSCNRLIKIPIAAYSIPRNFEYNTAVLDLGSICIGDTVRRMLTLFKNADTIPVLINTVDVSFLTKETGIFFINQPKDTVLNPGESYRAMIYYIPSKLGAVTAKVNIFFGNQDNVMMWFDIKATGIGSFVNNSHQKLLFLPDVDTRELEITNTGTLPVTYNQINVLPSGNYIVETPMPIILNPGEKKSIVVKWTQTNQNDAQLEFNTEPCIVQKYLPLAVYRGTSIVTILDTVADPRGNATIAIRFRNGGNGQFKGMRYFTAEFTVNPRLFLPLSVNSEFGAGEIITNKIIDNKRHIGFRVFGDFPDTGFVANINGVAGLGDSDVSPLEFVNTSAFWGATVNTSIKNGVLRLINICDDRLTERNINSFKIQSISPNPAVDIFNLDFTSEVSSNFEIEVIDVNGNILLNDKFIASIGENKRNYNIANLSAGKYKVVLKYLSEREAVNFIIIR